MLRRHCEAMCISDESVFMTIRDVDAMARETKREFVLITDLQGNKVRDWGSRGFGPGCFLCINSIAVLNYDCHLEVLVSDYGRVQAFRPADGSCLRVWTSDVCGAKLGPIVSLGCVRNLIYMLDILKDRIDVFSVIHGDKSNCFAFPVMQWPRHLSCGTEEVYVISLKELIVYSALDGTELRRLPPPCPIPTFPSLGSISCSPSGGALAITNRFPHVIYLISAADGSILGRTDFHDTLFAWQEKGKDDKLWALRHQESSVLVPFQVPFPIKLN